MGVRASERLFAVLLLLLSMQVEIGLTRPYEAELDAASASASVHVLDVVVQSVIQAFGIVLILRRWRRMVRTLQIVWPLTALAVWAVLSSGWSDQPTLTLRRSALLLLSTVFAIYLGERYSIEEQLELLKQVFCLMISVIVVLYFVAPHYVVDSISHAGAWKGLSAYKNAFGQYMSVAVIVFLLVKFQRYGSLRYAFLGAAALMLFKAKSASSLFCCILILLILPVLRVIPRVVRQQRPAVYSSVAIALTTGAYLMTTHSGRLYALLGKNSSLSGRTDLWASVFAAIMKHPLLGYGFDTFWASLKGEALDVRIGAGWMAQRSDNGFLDLGLGLGIIGFSLFLTLCIFSFRRAIKYLSHDSNPMNLWPVTFLCFFLVHNMAESTLLTKGDFPSLLFAMITTALAVNGNILDESLSPARAMASLALEVESPA